MLIFLVVSVKPLCPEQIWKNVWYPHSIHITNSFLLSGVQLPSYGAKKMLENYVELLEAILYGAEKFQYEANCNM